MSEMDNKEVLISPSSDPVGANLAESTAVPDDTREEKTSLTEGSNNQEDLGDFPINNDSTEEIVVEDKNSVVRIEDTKSEGQESNESQGSKEATSLSEAMAKKPTFIKEQDGMKRKITALENRISELQGQKPTKISLDTKLNERLDRLRGNITSFLAMTEVIILIGFFICAVMAGVKFSNYHWGEGGAASILCAIFGRLLLATPKDSSKTVAQRAYETIRESLLPKNER